MHDLKKISEADLIERTRSLVREERRIGVEILHHLREYERRSLYLKLGFASLFDYVVRELGYAEASAYRRISAMRALVDLPELEAKIVGGELSVTQIAQVQSFVREQKRERRIHYSKEKKRELFQSVAGKSKRETEMHFRSLAPERVRPEAIREIDGKSVEVRFEIDLPLRAKIEEVQVRASRELKGSTKFRDAVSYMADYTVRELRKKREFAVSLSSEAFESLNTVQIPRQERKASGVASSVSANSRYIPLDLKRRVFMRAEQRCEYVGSDGKRCDEIRFLEIDHIHPYSRGGSSTDAKNLQVLCRAHNQWRAVQMGLNPPQSSGKEHAE